MHLPRSLAALLFVAPLAAAPAAADDWPQYRGANGDNVSTESGWSVVGAEEPLWSVDIGWGYSSPLVADGRVYTVGYFERGDGRPGVGVDRVQCFDAETGAWQWTVEYPSLAFANEHGGGAIGTGTVADGVLYQPSRAGEVRAIDVATGELLWEVNLPQRHGVDPGRYGFASSPYVLGDSIVLNMASTVMLARGSGETLWISENHEANYSTVRPITLGDREGLVVFGAAGIVVIDAASGETIHSHVFRRSPRNVEGATPIVMGTRVFLSSAYDHGGVCVDFAGDEPELVWSTRRMRSKMSGCTLYEGHLYGFDESMLKCMDLEGRDQWRLRGLGHGALSIVDGHLLVTTSKGELVVARATPDGFEELSRRKVLDEGVFWTAPVLANGRVYYRGSHGDLVCLDHRAAAAADVTAAADPATTAGSLPTASALEAAYLGAIGVDARPIVDLKLSGRMHNDSLGLADRPATWSIGAGARWHCRFDLPPAFPGAIQMVWDGERAWTVDPYRGNAWLEGLALSEVRDTDGYRFVFDPLPDGADATTVGVEEFRGVRCHRVDVVLSDEVTRRVYFDAATGLLVGRDAEAENTVLFGEWKAVEGWRIPMHRTVFDADTGEETRWRFTEAELEPIDPTLFEPPADLTGEEEPPEEGGSGQAD